MSVAKRTPPQRAQRKSKYAGIQASESKTPFPNPGDYLFLVTEMVEGFNPGTQRESVKVKLEVIEADGPHANEIGDTVAMVEVHTTQGLGRVKAFVMAAAGFESEDEYDQFDPDGFFMDACTGGENEYSDSDRLAVGRLVRGKVTRGKERDDGDYYRNFSWTVVPDDEQQ